MLHVPCAGRLVVTGDAGAKPIDAFSRGWVGYLGCVCFPVWVWHNVSASLPPRACTGPSGPRIGPLHGSGGRSGTSSCLGSKVLDTGVLACTGVMSCRVSPRLLFEWLVRRAVLCCVPCLAQVLRMCAPLREAPGSTLLLTGGGAVHRTL